jgi:hypothetical protein
VKLHLGTLTLASPDFVHGGALPQYATANGAKESLALEWFGVPAGTQSFALVCTDPDAPLTHGFDHWVLYNLDASATSVPRAVAGVGTIGPNGVEVPEWYPAEPPPGHGLHFYYFHLFALDRTPDLPPGLNRLALLAAIDDSILEQARLVGHFQR